MTRDLADGDHYVGSFGATAQGGNPQHDEVLQATREQPAVHVSCFDPGLMPGTGLARQYPPTARLAWSTVFRAAQVLPFASSPAASGRALAALACDLTPPAPSGCYLDHRLRVRQPSRLAQDPAYQDRVLQQSRALLAEAT